MAPSSSSWTDYHREKAVYSGTHNTTINNSFAMTNIANSGYIGASDAMQDGLGDGDVGNIPHNVAYGYDNYGNITDDRSSFLVDEIASHNDIPLCLCDRPCKIFTSRQPNSLNRQFYKCAADERSGQHKCDFFQWADGNDSNISGYSNSSSSSSSSSSGNSASIIPRGNGYRDYMSEVKRVFGHNSFRHGQRECIEAALSGRDVFCLMPTGGGKSLVYQLPAICCPGLAVVFSPLISLIQDQVEAMTAVGIRAVSFASNMSTNGSYNLNDSFADVENRALFDELRNMRGDQGDNDIKMLYITPEKFSKSEYLKRVLKGLCSRGLLSRFVIDEAHCMSQWGHDFRPDYLSLRQIREEFPSVPIMALTATANKNVVNDSIETIRMRDPFMHTQSFNRPNITYSVKAKNKNTLKEDIPNYIRARLHLSGIVYCLSRKDTETVSDLLQEAIPELRRKITFYHADLPTEERERRQRAWCKGDVRVICATIAFGMGINKPGHGCDLCHDRVTIPLH
jgi:superfamily II DNA helicase RecQ